MELKKGLRNVVGWLVKIGVLKKEESEAIQLLDHECPKQKAILIRKLEDLFHKLTGMIKTTESRKINPHKVFTGFFRVFISEHPKRSGVLKRLIEKLKSHNPNHNAEKH